MRSRSNSDGNNASDVAAPSGGETVETARRHSFSVQNRPKRKSWISASPKRRSLLHFTSSSARSNRLSTGSLSSTEDGSTRHSWRANSSDLNRLSQSYDDAPQRQRAPRPRSVSSVSFFLNKAPESPTLPIFQAEVGETEVQDFLKGVQTKEKTSDRPALFQKVFATAWKIGLAYFFSSHSAFAFGSLIFLSWGCFRAWLPLFFCLFEKHVDDPESRDASEVAVIIPAYKAAGALPETIECCLKIFKPEQIFIIANGRSPTPLDNAAEVCEQYGVNHAWVGIGSKITAEFVGVALAEKYKYILLIDDDVHLPPNFPLVTDRLNETTACIGYTIKSTGANGSKGSVFQQAQDMEYKLSGLSRTFMGVYGSATFPHGAVILWDRVVLQELFYSHPGFAISEDWYFGHTCRSSGYRIQFCSQVFVETETPPCLFLPEKSTRGGYGEMTVWKQRFYRWNFFYLYRLRDDFYYLLFAWRLGRYELVTKFFVFCEVYDSMTYILRVFVWPISLAASPKVTMTFTTALIGVYVTGFIIFNSIHLRQKNEMIAWKILPVYFAMKFALVFVNTASVYYTMYAYANFFTVRHPMVTENHDALAAARECMQKARGADNAVKKALDELNGVDGELDDGSVTGGGLGTISEEGDGSPMKEESFEFSKVDFISDQEIDEKSAALNDNFDPDIMIGPDQLDPVEDYTAEQPRDLLGEGTVGSCSV
ncbi:MAG: hypothetical protein M1837_006917 [Sclerophora amabilis]|nr:MAG: hypothetical protein M1837_006917 [Sclerophora amabilis]